MEVSDCESAPAFSRALQGSDLPLNQKPTSLDFSFFKFFVTLIFLKGLFITLQDKIQQSFPWLTVCKILRGSDSMSIQNMTVSHP